MNNMDVLFPKRKNKKNKKKKPQFLKENKKSNNNKTNGIKLKRKPSIKTSYFSKKNNKKFIADSLAERYRMFLLDNDKSIKKWIKNTKFKIKYLFENKIRNYIPDFIIETINGEQIIEEVKGRITLKDIAKYESLKEYASKNGYKFSFLTTEKMKGYSKYVNNFFNENKNNKGKRKK